MTFWITAITRETAERRAMAIYLGDLPLMPFYASRDAADEWCAWINQTHTDKHEVHEISIGAKQERIAA